MASLLNPYLNFRSDAREALEFYRDVFGGELKLSTFGEYGDTDAATSDLIMHGQLETDQGYTLMGADTPPGMDHTAGSTITVSLSGDDPALLHGYWDQLALDGTVTMPLEKQMWGDEFGMCTDRFGVAWLVNISQPQS